jgi:hypothetical protein
VAEGLLVALLVSVNVLVEAVAAVGLNETFSLQVLPGAIATLHVPSVALNGAVVMAAVMTRLAVPVFVTVAVLVSVAPRRVWPKATLPMVAVAVAAAAGVTPVPVSARIDGEPAAS